MSGLRCITVTANPALDLSTRTPRVEPTHKLRCSPPLRHPGGGGINVARVLHRLGLPVQAWALLAGPAGAQLAALLAEEHVALRAFAVTGDTRQSFAVIDDSSGAEYRFALPGPEVDAAHWQALLDALPPADASAPGRPWLVASGSLPPGLPDTAYAALTRRARAQGWRVALDSSGAALDHALAAGVDLVKPSLRELRQATGAPLANMAEQAAAARALVARGQAAAVALSLGDAGALLATARGCWQQDAVPVPAGQGSTGAGDSFLAGLLWAWDQGWADAQALGWASACGAAAVMAAGTGLAAPATVQALHARRPPVRAL